MLIGFLNFSGPQREELLAGDPPAMHRTSEDLVAELSALIARNQLLLSEKDEFTRILKPKL